MVRTCVNTTNVEDNDGGHRSWTKTGTQFVAIYNGAEGADWENLYYTFVEMSEEVDVRKPSGISRAKTL